MTEYRVILLTANFSIRGVRKTRTTPYHPQSDGLVERFNKTLLEMLSKTVMERERDWDLFYHRFCLRMGQALMKPQVLHHSS